jgi:hypothetical protein
VIHSPTSPFDLHKIYILTTSSIKYYVNKVFGTPTPPGVDGLSNILEKATATVEADMDDKKSS